MFLQIEEFLTSAEVESVLQLARQTKFIEGRRSNPYNVTKNTLICDPADPLGQKAAQIALMCLQRSEQARNFAFPLRIAVPQLARYDAGMTYGPHIDAAFLSGGPQPLRSDVSCTIFVSDPASYEGGELVVHLGSREVRIKGQSGEAVFYPSTTLHEVTPITAGVRMVLVTFIESQIPDPLKRDLLYTLGEVRALEALKMAWGNRVQLDYVIQNLTRMWSS